MMRRLVLMCMAAALALVLCAMEGATGETHAQGALVRKPVQELMEIVGRQVFKTGGRSAVEELASLGGEAGVRRIVDRALREGGDEAVEALVRHTRRHGADALRAADNAAHISRLTKALDDLPESAAGQAMRRLGAGQEGRALAQVVDRYGAPALRAEVAHPGVGGRVVGSLGRESAPIVGNLSTEQAIALARHADDIARLPAAQRDGVLRILHRDAERMVGFMGRFVERNPGKVLFTASATTVILANADRVLGGSDIVFDDQGVPIVISAPGVMERMAGQFLSTMLKPLLPVLAVAAAIWLGVKLWFACRLARIRFEANRERIRRSTRGAPGKPEVMSG